MPGTLFVVATPIGNLEDITLRALRVLREVSVVAAEDTRRTAHLLARHAISTPTTSLHEHNEGQKAAAILARLERGESVALVSDAGTPTISDPGSRLIRGAIGAGFRVEPIPGPSAVLAALAVSGLSTESFSFMGFPPTRSKNRKQWLDRVLAVGGVVVFFEAPHRIRRTLEDLLKVAGDCAVVVGRELTKLHEELVRGPISLVLRSLTEARGEFTVIAEIGAPNVNIGQTTEQINASRREALAMVAKSHGLSPNALYAALERAKKSVE
jgi:16S rRNA (cytidine1402-2'-O)-methyltransferase